MRHGSGSVSSQPAGIDCPTTCSFDFADGSEVTLTASADAGSTFAGWSADCSAEPCSLTMDADHAVTASFELVPSADLALTKGDDPDPVASGAQLTYALSVDNAGPDTATAVVLTDTLPAGVGFVSATPSLGDCAEEAGLVTCQLGDLLSGGSATVSIVVSAPTVETTTQITNDAAVSSDTDDPNLTDNSASAETSVEPPPVTFSLDVSLAGDGSGSVSSQPAGIDCPTTCSFDFADGSEVTLTASADPGSTFAGWSADCSAEPCSLTMDADHAVTATFELVPSADLALTKGDDPDPVASGAQLTYALGVDNAGPDTATGVVLTDTLPAGVGFVSATPSLGDCAEEAGLVTCQLGDLLSGGSATVSIVVSAPTVETTTLITNGAAVSSDTDDPNPTTTAPAPRPRSSRRRSPSAWTSAWPVTAAAASAASRPALTARPPAASTSPTAAPVTLTATADPGSTFAGWSADCSAEPCSLTMDADHAVTATFELVPSADLALTKGDDPDPVTSGDELTYAARRRQRRSRHRGRGGADRLAAGRCRLRVGHAVGG